MNNEMYRKICDEYSVPLFNQAWWLDTVVGEDGWEFLTATGKAGDFGIMPYVFKKKFGFRLISQPPLTQNSGPWIYSESVNDYDLLSSQKEIMFKIIDELPKFSHFSQNWAPELLNWLPFYWRGFSQSTRYTYTVNLDAGEEELWEALAKRIKGEIKKAKNRFGLFLSDDSRIQDFIDLNEQVFRRQGIKRPYSEALVQRIFNASRQRGQGQCLMVQDAEGRCYAGALLVWDSERAYYLLSGSDPSVRNSGAMALCLWEAMKFAKKKSRIFDFEGSMIEPIEFFFRAFGAVQTPYFNVYKTPSLPLRLYSSIRGLR